MHLERDNKQCQLSESEELYDLYNACNGEIDSRKPDNLSDKDAQILDAPKLRELWLHIASQCDQCEAIIDTLNWARRALQQAFEADVSSRAPSPGDSSDVGITGVEALSRDSFDRLVLY